MQLDHLPDLGVTRMQSSRWQEIARVPEPLFEGYMPRCLVGVGFHSAANPEFCGMIRARRNASFCIRR
jgi:hypothetical protein